MCKMKQAAKTKTDRLIEAIDLLNRNIEKLIDLSLHLVLVGSAPAEPCSESGAARV